MGLFDTLEKVTNDLLKSLKPEEVIKLRSCKNCSFYQNGYCTQTSPPTKILSEYYAQGCIYYASEQVTTGLISASERETASSLIDRIKLIDQVSLIDLISTITTISTIQTLQQVTNIANLQSVDLIDAITNIANIQSVDLIDTITKINTINQIKDVSIRNIKGLMLNTGLEFGDFTGWMINASQEPYLFIDNYWYHTGKYSCLIEAGTHYIGYLFDVPINCKRIRSLGIWVYPFNEPQNFRIYAFYTDGTQTYHVFSVTVKWQFCDMQPYLDTTKKLKYVWFRNYNNTYGCNVDDAEIDVLPETIIMGTKGLEGRTYALSQDQAGETVLCDFPNKQVTLESLEWTSNDQNECQLRVYPYKKDGTLDSPFYIWYFVGGIGGGGIPTQPFPTHNILHSYGSDWLEELYYDATNEMFKAGLKKQMTFPNGIKIILKVLSDGSPTHNTTIGQVALSVAGD